MSPATKRLSLITLGVVVYFVLIIVVWAARPLEDSVPVGVDWTPTTLVPPKAQQEISQRVECSTVFDSEPRPDEPLPALKPQPEGRPPLEYQRPPCELVHTNARWLFLINTVAVAAALVVIALVAVRIRKRGDAVASNAAAEARSSR